MSDERLSRPLGKQLAWIYGRESSLLLVFVTLEPDCLYYVWVHDDRGNPSLEYTKPTKSTWTYAFKTKVEALQQMRQTAGYGSNA
jgi:hypothetical protein